MTRTGTDARSFEPWKLRGGGAADARRRELFARAAPVFRAHGYRGSTIKAIAHACGVRPATIYHYFRSKEELATYLLRQPRLDWNSTWVSPGADPLAQLGQLVDLAIEELPNYLLAVSLADEIAGVVGQPRPHAPTFAEGEAVFARFIAAAAPAMARAEATAVARAVLAGMVGSAVIGLDPEPAGALRDRTIGILRPALVPRHVAAGAFDAALAGSATE